MHLYHVLWIQVLTMSYKDAETSEPDNQFSQFSCQEDLQCTILQASSAYESLSNQLISVPHPTLQYVSWPRRRCSDLRHRTALTTSKNPSLVKLNHFPPSRHLLHISDSSIEIILQSQSQQYNITHTSKQETWFPLLSSARSSSPSSQQELGQHIHLALSIH